MKWVIDNNRRIFGVFNPKFIPSRQFSSHAKPIKIRSSRKKVYPLIAIGVLSSAYVIDRYYYSSTITRSIRALSILTYVGLKYKFTLAENYKQLHESASDLLYNMLIENKGLYIKFGQAIANQGTIFPIEFQRKLIKLYDEAPSDDWQIVDKNLRGNLGEDYEDRIFKSIDHNPIASASIAQVHKGILKNGEEVAVKVQHDYIDKQVNADLLVYRAVIKLYEIIFQIPMSFYSKYVSNQTLSETDFNNELKNTETLRHFIENDSSVKNLGIYIPKTYREFSTDKVLVMEWVDGISLVKKQQLIDLKFDLSLVMHQFITIFSKQIFKYGFVHSDPHPGNLLVRMNSKNKQELVILDHGLYVRFTEKFRKEYCELWKCLFSFDISGLNEIGKKWGIQSMEMFGTLIQLKPVKLSEQERNRNQSEMMRNFFSDTTKFPLDLLFLGRVMRIIQTTNKELGSPINRINYLTNEALNSLIIESNLKNWFGLIKLKTSLFISTVIFWVFRIRQVLKGDKYGFKNMGLEDSIEDYMKQTAKDMGMELE